MKTNTTNTDRLLADNYNLIFLHMKEFIIGELGNGVVIPLNAVEIMAKDEIKLIKDYITQDFIDRLPALIKAQKAFNKTLDIVIED